MSTVSLLTTGGTIATGPGPDGASPQRGADELADLVRTATAGGPLSAVELRSREVVRLPSHAMTPQTMYLLAQHVQQEIDGGADGVVITHGTDTMEETAYALAMLVDTPVPVVVTGAMRPPHHPGPDGAANLVAAVVAASEPTLAAYGPVVAHQDELHLARWVTKMYSARVAAFGSPATGPVAAVSEDRVVTLQGPPAVSDRLPVSGPPAHRVELLWASAGADGLLLTAIADQVDGLVMAGAGGGHLPAAMAEAAALLAESGLPVVLSSRCVVPQVLTNTYSGLGSEVQLQAAGLISAGALQPLKARLRLIAALTAGLDPHDVFAIYGGHQ